MRLVFNRFVALGQRTGIGHYAAQLLRHLLPKLGPGEELDVFPTGWTWRLGRLWGRARPWLTRDEKGPPGAVRTGAVPTPRSWSASLRAKLLVAARRSGQAYLARRMRTEAAHGNYDLYLEPNTIPLRCAVPALTTVHDLSALLHPQWHPAGRVAHFEKHFLASLPRSRHFLADTEFTRQEMLAHLPVRREQITPVHLGVREDLGPLPPARTAELLRRHGWPPRYLVYVGTLEPRKNLLMLMRAYCALPDDVRRDCPLLIVGGWGWNSGDIAEFLHERGRARGIIHLGYLRDDSLAVLYNGARALVFPSFYEGFGLPPLEMMACGGAVLASTAGAVVETAGAKAHLLDPRDEDGWRHAMHRVIRDDDWWRTLREGAVEVARAFTWDRCAQETLHVIRRCCGRQANDTSNRRAA